MDGHKLFDSSWQSMAIDVKPVCPDIGECVLVIEQSIDMVLDIDRSRRPRGMFTVGFLVLRAILTRRQTILYPGHLQVLT